MTNDEFSMTNLARMTKCRKMSDRVGHLHGWPLIRPSGLASAAPVGQHGPRHSGREAASLYRFAHTPKALTPVLA